MYHQLRELVRRIMEYTDFVTRDAPTPPIAWDLKELFEANFQEPETVERATENEEEKEWSEDVLIERAKAEQEKQRTDREKHRADQERFIAYQERQRTDRMRLKLAILLAEKQSVLEKFLESTEDREIDV